ncbi:MAG: 5-bromo-4-chloroindolyl phosphate hydrolysis family protein [Oscillospiraceae bacterium]|nr:5-bromo-4-chloroindolyl phosphate hydrolysis family protein [Oscillospiraceae bacterium]
MREIKHKSAAPFYGAAVAWALYALIFPLYRLGDLLIFLALGCAVYAVMGKLFPGTVEYVKLPVDTGDKDIDALLTEGETAVNELAKLRESIPDHAVKVQIGEIIDVTDKIFKDVLDDPGDYRQVRRFADFYLPTTIKLLHAYDRFGKTGAISGTMRRIEEVLGEILDSYRKQYDALFRNQALDIETDIEVLEQLLKKEGLTGSDFK